MVACVGSAGAGLGGGPDLFFGAGRRSGGWSSADPQRRCGVGRPGRLIPDMRARYMPAPPLSNDRHHQLTELTSQHLAMPSRPARRLHLRNGFSLGWSENSDRIGACSNASPRYMLALGWASSFLRRPYQRFTPAHQRFNQKKHRAH